MINRIFASSDEPLSPRARGAQKNSKAVAHAGAMVILTGLLANGASHSCVDARRIALNAMPPEAFNLSTRSRFPKSEMGHVWTAPIWQGHF